MMVDAYRDVRHRNDTIAPMKAGTYHELALYIAEPPCPTCGGVTLTDFKAAT
jgi:hypothetical protein